MNPVTSEADVEQIALDLFEDMQWSPENVMDEVFGEHGTLGREHRGEVVLLRRLRPALEKLNPGLPTEAIDLAIEELTRDRSAMSPVQANREIYRLLEEGVQVRIGTSDDEADTNPRVHVIDGVHPDWRKTQRGRAAVKTTIKG
jgi:type I restriction enzyme R subunit